MRALRTRLDRLERLTRDAEAQRPRLETPGQWLAAFDAMAREGYFAAETDFPEALRLFRAAVRRGDPRPVEWEWVGEILSRVVAGKPPVTEAEYLELAAWYDRNSVTDRRDGRANLRFALTTGGPRRRGATEVVEELRALRAAHPEWTRCLATGKKPSRCRERWIIDEAGE
jgi:hypothetical protein